MRYAIINVLFLVALLGACAAPDRATTAGPGVNAAAEAPRPQPVPPGSGTAVYAAGEIIYQYDPVPALVAPVTEVLAARYPAIDIHCHWSTREDPQAMLRAMDERGILAAVNLSGGWGERLDEMLGRYHELAPARLLIFCNIDFSRIDEPDFGAQMRQFLIDAHGRGVSGLKIFKDLGLRIRDASGALVAVDDPRLDPIWATCAELGMPVLIHTADPAAFFAPIDEDNERWMQLRRHPDWSFHGDEFPDREDVLAQRDRAVERHPQTIFIGAHLAGNAEDLRALAVRLDRYPNLFVDISGRVAELGRQPRAARKFLIEYQDRVLFGTDRYPGRADQPRHRIYFRFLETADEYFKYYDHPFPPTGEWRIDGVDLPDEALRKIYHDNAARLLGLEQ